MNTAKSVFKFKLTLFCQLVTFVVVTKFFLLKIQVHHTKVFRYFPQSQTIGSLKTVPCVLVARGAINKSQFKLLTFIKICGTYKNSNIYFWLGLMGQCYPN